MTKFFEGAIIDGQTYTVNQQTSAEINKDYIFNGLPAYEQFPSYDEEVIYKLNTPDGKTKEISTNISNGKITISKEYLTQGGEYSLTASVLEGTALNNIVYITNFKINKSNNDKISKKIKSPYTGDDMMVVSLIILFLASGGYLVIRKLRKS